MRKGGFKALMGDIAPLFSMGGSNTNSKNLRAWENIELALEELLKDERFSCKCYEFSEAEVNRLQSDLQGEKMWFGLGEDGYSNIDFRPFESSVFIEPHLLAIDNSWVLGDGYVIYVFNGSIRYRSIGHTPMNSLFNLEKKAASLESSPRPFEYETWGVRRENGQLVEFSLPIISKYGGNMHILDPKYGYDYSPFKMKEILESAISEKLIKSFDWL
jgi:hypothetical protein